MKENDLQSFIKNDMEQTAAKAIKSESVGIDVVRSTPTLDKRASAQPSVKDIADKNYSDKTGVSLVHPLHLMTLMQDESPWVDLAVRVIGSACSSTVPLFRVTTTASKSYKKKRQADIDKITDLLMYPNPHQTGYELFRTIYENLALYGNAYLQIIKKGDGGIHSLYTLPPETMRAVPYYDQYNILHFGYVQVNIAAEPRIFLEDEIIHFKTTNPKSFVYGKPLFLSQLVQIATSINAKKSLASWFEQGFVGGAIFKQDSDPDVAQRNREFIKEFYTTPDNFGRTMILEGNMELVRDGNKFVDFDFEQLNNAERDNILIAAGVPVSQAGVRSDSGNANAEVVAAEESAFIRNTFGMFHNLVFEKINSKLFRQILGWTDVKIEAGAPIRFSLKEAIETVNALSRIGVQINEARDLLSVARVPDEDAGKTFVINTNNGVIKASDTLGIDLNTGEEMPTIMEIGADGFTDFSGANGLGGDLKKKAEKKPKAE